VRRIRGEAHGFYLLRFQRGRLRNAFAESDRRGVPVWHTVKKKHKSHNGEPGRVVAVTRGGVRSLGRGHDDDSGRSTPAAFSSKVLVSPPRGRSENHAARPLDRPARSHDSANIGGSAPNNGIPTTVHDVSALAESRALVILFFFSWRDAEFLERPSRDREFRESDTRSAARVLRDRQTNLRFNFSVAAWKIFPIYADRRGSYVGRATFSSRILNYNKFKLQ